MSDDMIKFGKDGKPTEETMQYLFKEDRDKFLEFQDKYFTTKSKMKETPFDGTVQEIFKKMKGKKDVK